MDIFDIIIDKLSIIFDFTIIKIFFDKIIGNDINYASISNIFTSIFIICIIVIFGVYTKHYNKKYKYYKKIISDYIDNIKKTNNSNIEIIEKNINNKNIKTENIYKKLYDALLKDNGIYYRIKETETYINDDLASEFLKSKFLPWGATLLTSIGVTGTFLGLLFGISNLNLGGSVSDLQKQISEVASGASTAFVTSIWGVVSGLVVTYFGKLKSNELSDKIFELQNLIDSKFEELPILNNFLDISHELIDNRLNINNIISINNKIAEYINNGNNLRFEIKEILNDIKEYIKKENDISYEIKDVIDNEIKETLKDTKDGIDQLAEQIGSKIQEELPKALDEGLSRVINETFVPAIQEMSQTFKNMAEKLSNGSQSVVEATFKDIVDKFTFLGVEQRKELVDSVVNVSIAMNKTTEKLSEIVVQSNDLNTRIEEIQRTTQIILQQGQNLESQVSIDGEFFRNSSEFMKESSDSLSSATSNLNNFSKDIGARIAEASMITDKASESIRITTDRYKEIISQINILIKSIISNIDNTKQTVTYLISNIEDGEKNHNNNLNQLISNLLNVVNQMDNQGNTNNESLRENINHITEKLSEFVDYFKDIQSQSKTHENDYIDRQKELILSVESVISQSEKLQSIINNDSKKFFEAAYSLEKTSKSFDSATNTLNTFSNTMSNGVSEASKSISNINNIIDETSKQYTTVSSSMEKTLYGINDAMKSFKPVEESFEKASIQATIQAKEISNHFIALEEEMKRHRNDLEQTQKTNLQNLNNEVTRLLQRYTELVQEQVNKMMGEWNKQTEDFSDKLVHATQYLADALDNIESFRNYL